MRLLIKFSKEISKVFQFACKVLINSITPPLATDIFYRRLKLLPNPIGATPASGLPIHRKGIIPQLLPSLEPTPNMLKL